MNIKYFSNELKSDEKLKENNRNNDKEEIKDYFKFMEEKEDLSYETFNLTKDTLTVKEVAEICKKHKLEIRWSF